MNLEGSRLLILASPSPQLDLVCLDLARWVHQLRVASAVTEAQLMLRHFEPSVVLICPALQDGNGLDFLGALRQKGDALAFIWTDDPASTEVLWALQHHADGVLPTGVPPQVLRLMLQAVLRRLPPVGGYHHLHGQRFGDLLVNTHNRFISGPDGRVLLGEKENLVLEELLAHTPPEVSRERLRERLYRGKELESNRLEGRIATLRKKIKQAGSAVLLASTLTVDHGSGYVLIPPETIDP